MQKYEALYIINPNMEEEERAALIQKFSDIVSSNGGQPEKIDEWGKRKLAYPINYINDGYYVLMNFSAPAELPRELERNFKISEFVMRFMVTCRPEVEKQSPAPVKVDEVIKEEE